MAPGPDSGKEQTSQHQQMLTAGLCLRALRRSRQQQKARVSRDSSTAAPATAMTTMAQVGREVPPPPPLTLSAPHQAGV